MHDFQVFSPIHRLPFILLIVSFAVKNFFLSDVVSLNYFHFCCLCFWCNIQKVFANTNVKKLVPCLFQKFQFQVLCLSLIHFKIQCCSMVLGIYSFLLVYPICQHIVHNSFLQVFVFLWIQFNVSSSTYNFIYHGPLCFFLINLAKSLL